MKIFEILVESIKPSMKSVMKELISIFSKNDIDYIIGGAQALSTYSKRPRMTIDIDVFIDINEKEKVDQILSKKFKLIDIGRFHSKFSKDDVEIDVLYSGSDAEDYAIKHKQKTMILGVNVNVPSPEALLWLYLVSSKEQNFVDAIELVRSIKDINIDLIRLEIKNIPSLSSKLDDIIERSKKIQTRFSKDH